MTVERNQLTRFLTAQEATFERAMNELRAGRKRTHWMWFIFPQLRGLGRSSTADFYGIADEQEAKDYLAHPVLGPRLVAACEAVLAIQNKSARQIFGTPDDLKLRSCATLFAAISPPDSVFHQLLEKYFGGEPDQVTIRRLREA